MPAKASKEPVRTVSNFIDEHQNKRPGIKASLPRRQLITSETTEVSPPMMHVSDFSISYLRVIWRLVRLLLTGLSFFIGNTWDRLRRRGSETQRAIRLRRILENSGGALKKIGRLMAMRIDLLPWTYCVELSKIDDTMPPFPVEQAIDRVEVATGHPLAKVFDQFDPEPIVSSTTSCVYQAYLKDGQKVAVKVRRPGFGEL